MEGLKNMMEDNVAQMLKQLLPTMPNICSCEDCRLDMATYALNRLRPKYARTATGVVMHRFETSSAQAETKILTEVVSAINIIGSHPHHPPINAADEQVSTDTGSDSTTQNSSGSIPAAGEPSPSTGNAAK